ncbi:LysR family transcriptional regulator [Streptomyces oceani]|uniref:LysR family transcriptional regulator n=1 Tax=Streptomyces oceani TaxID=1075402 RepID=A0A1E7KJ23_9ACTN|nr:LysR family transcriptional regulator [Streptomyces oceani]OEV03905.1 LysR family transcriptional regulator [Streptomyces oceani]
MDVVSACRAFVSVSDRGSFTVGAAAARTSQSVASRRVAALERHLGEQLFERTSRRPTLTPFGQDMLPFARRLVRLAESLEHEAERARRRPLRLAVPGTCSTGELAYLVADARSQGVALEPQVGTPMERAELVRAQEVRAAVLAVPPDEAIWTVPLGLAGTRDPGRRRVYLETLRVGRADASPPRRIWIQPEDDVPHVRDPITRLRDAVGLRPAQLVVAGGLTAAVAEVLYSSDLLLCSAAQAEELGLHWRPVGELALARGFALSAVTEGERARVLERLDDVLARCLGTGPDPVVVGPGGDGSRAG